MGVEALLLHIVALRRIVPAVTDRVERQRLEGVIRDLQRELGIGVSKRPAGRVLGVSVQALERWIERGRLPVVRRPRSSRELIDSDALIVLTEEVARRREAGQRRALLASSLDKLERSGRMPRRLRPNQSARELRQEFLATTPEQRLRAAASLSATAAALARR